MMRSPSHIWNRTCTLSRDSLKLLQAMWRAPATRRRDVLLQHARTSNSGEPNHVAVNLLSFEKELNLVRYHGIRGYLTEEKQYKLPFATLLGSSSFSSKATTSATPDNDDENSVEPKETREDDSPTKFKTAKVAFMVTASMRQELVQRLKYTPQHIKSLTPTDAMLIIENSVKPEHVQEKLPVLQEEYAKEQALAAAEAAKQQQRAAAAARQQREREMMMDLRRTQDHPQQNEEEKEDSQQNLADSADALLPEDDKVADEQQQQQQQQGTTWYQVVERKDGNNSEEGEEPAVVGMYLDKEEAEFGQQTHQDLADSRAEREKNTKKTADPSAIKRSTFEIRTVVKE